MSTLSSLFLVLPILLAVAFMTVLERKGLAYLQRRVGPDTVGVFGLLQPFADALKLIVKETVLPQHASLFLFFLAPIVSLFFSLLGWAVIPFGQGIVLWDFEYSLLFTFAVSSVGVFGTLLAGFSANSKYAFIGSLRSTSQMISYELVLSTSLLCVCFIAFSFNYETIVESQVAIWYIIPLFPVLIIFFISILAETNRTPFDLPEAESELVAGFFTEHSSVIFVFYFLAEYSSILLMSTLFALLFLGGYNCPEPVLQSLLLGFKSSMVAFLFIWVRATLPRLRYEQLIEFTWMQLLPMICALLFLVITLIV